MKKFAKMISLSLLSICLLVASPLMTVYVIRSSPVIEAPIETEPVTETEASPEETTEATTDPETQPEPEPLAFTESEPSYFDDALFIGDAHIGRLRQFGTLRKADYLCASGLTVPMLLNGETLEKTTLAEKLESKPYAKIYLMVGFNESGDGADTFRQNLTVLLETLRDAQPDALLYLMENPPLTKAASVNDPLRSSLFLDPINETLREQADGTQVFFLDCGEFMRDDSGYLREDASADGTHLREALYPELCTWLCQHTIVRKYMDESEFSFGDAVEAMRQGYHAARQSWEQVWLELSDDGQIVMRSESGPLPWTPGQEDLLAGDWILVP